MAKFRTKTIAKQGTGAGNKATFGEWAIGSHDAWDGVNFQTRRWTIDCQAAAAKVYRGMTASQFGHGKYTLKLTALPTNNAFFGDPGRAMRARVKVNYYPPTYYRKEALKELKRVETWDNTSGSTDIEDVQDLRVRSLDNKPLLLMAAELTDELPENHGTPAVLKGSQIIRFGFHSNYPSVFRQSGLTVDINQDGDLDEEYERQDYVLTGEDNEHFAIIDRMEGAVNPSDTNNLKLVERTWAYPMNRKKVMGWETREEELEWFESRGQKTITIPDIRALGGLIGIEMDFCDTTQNFSQNFELGVELICHEWTKVE